MTKKETMRKDELQALAINANILQKDQVGAKLKYAAAATVRANKTELEKLEALNKEKLEMIKLGEAIRVEHADKDAAGKPIVNDGIYQGLSGNEKFNAAFDGYEKDLEEFNKKYAAIMAETVDVEIHKIKEADVTGGETKANFHALFPLFEK